MTPEQLDALCAAAMKRITDSVNRSAGQHLRAMRMAWAIRHAANTNPKFAKAFQS